ncbi:MAG: hypothetical protein RRC34_00430 [Lentisphaeria bacterium]|nr:hypothetical protein [Lentisphaeria bacterium]
MSEKRITGCGILVLLLVCGPILLYGGCKTKAWLTARHQSLAQEKRARETFTPVLDKMRDAAETNADTAAYDIDTTVRVIHQIDLAMRERDTIIQYIHDMAATDYRGVAPDILSARADILAVLMEMYGKQVELNQQNGLWEMASEFILTTTSVISVDISASSIIGVFTGGGGMLVNSDREQAASLLDKLHKKQEEKKQTLRAFNKLQGDLVTAVMNYAGVYHKYLDEWDKLCAKRDRAYLAAKESDWRRVRESAGQAIRSAPAEREAHLLHAMACIEENAAFKGIPLTSVIDDLKRYTDRHPGSTAPALLLLGNAYHKLGDADEAALCYKQAAAYYPKQAEALTDMLNPYRARAFLRKTREGGSILQQYKSMMLGAGYFSPDLQLARALFSQHNREEATRKVMDHFTRRRNQSQWDFILSDIQFCHELMGEDYEKIFPADFYLDLVIDEGVMSDTRMRVGVNNRTDRDLRNGSLILCVNFTDMYEGDYETFTVGNTLPLIPANMETSFGKITIDKELLGRRRDLRDIVRLRAILLANEAVVWVDTPEYKTAEIIDKAARAGKLAPEKLAVAPWEMKASRQPSIGDDHMDVDLPAAFVRLRPVFQLIRGGRVFSPSHDTVEGGNIKLRFNDAVPDNHVKNGVDIPPMNLKMDTRFGTVDLTVDIDDDGKIKLRFK